MSDKMIPQLHENKKFSMQGLFSFTLMYICLIFALCLGFSELIFGDKEERASYTENRILADFPEFSIAAITSGSFTSEFEIWLTDAFFFRDSFAEAKDKICDIFSLPEKESATVTVNQDMLFETTVSNTGDDESATDEDTYRIAAEEYLISEETVDNIELSDAYLWMINSKGEYEVSEIYTAAELYRLADNLNRYKALVPEGNVHFINVPSSEYFMKITYGSYTGIESNIKEMLETIVDEGVFIYDASSILAPYLDNYTLFPTTDHHWHSFTVSAILSKMLNNMGIPAANYEDFYYYPDFLYGENAYSTDVLSKMSISEDSFLIPQNVTPVESYVLKHLTERDTAPWLDLDDTGYRQFLGGTYGPWRLFITGFNTGRNALVIGDSYENAFITFLYPYYDSIISTDLRTSKYIASDAGATVSEYMKEYDVDDVYIITCTYSPIGGSMLQTQLVKYLGDGLS